MAVHPTDVGNILGRGKGTLRALLLVALGLNDKLLFEATGRRTGGRGAKGKAVEMEDIKFHQCVRLARFENDRTISFIPPDGEFELMSYRLTQVRGLPGCLCARGC